MNISIYYHVNNFVTTMLDGAPADAVALVSVILSIMIFAGLFISPITMVINAMTGRAKK